MKKTTKRAALELLNIQFAHIATRNNKRDKDEQSAYYMGQRLMLALILSENCTRPGDIIRDENGRHYYQEKGARI